MPTHKVTFGGRFLCRLSFLGAVVAILIVAEVLPVLPERLLLVALHRPHGRARADFCEEVKTGIEIKSIPSPPTDPENPDPVLT